jgi:hypothetical protein
VRRGAQRNQRLAAIDSAVMFMVFSISTSSGLIQSSGQASQSENKAFVKNTITSK